MCLRRPGGVGREKDAAHGVHLSVVLSGMLAPRPLSVTCEQTLFEPHDQDRRQRVRFVVADPHPDALMSERSRQPKDSDYALGRSGHEATDFAGSRVVVIPDRLSKLCALNMSLDS